jgi:hypothetical protein
MPAPRFRNVIDVHVVEVSGSFPMRAVEAMPAVGTLPAPLAPPRPEDRIPEGLPAPDPATLLG